jgi:hypothetical protein
VSGEPRQKRKYSRLRTRNQHTVRLDERLAELCRITAEADGLSFTDACEQGLSYWMEKKGATGVPPKLRFIWRLLDPESQKLLWSFAVFMQRRNSSTPFHKETQKYFQKILEMIPKEEVRKGLEELARFKREPPKETGI